MDSVGDTQAFEVSSIWEARYVGYKRQQGKFHHRLLKGFGQLKLLVQTLFLYK